jgi:hypothetical protein
MIRKLSFCAGVFLAFCSAVVLGDLGIGLSVCSGTCDDANAQPTSKIGVTACDQASTGYTCIVPAGETSFSCPACIHNSNEPAKCRCLIGSP